MALEDELETTPTTTAWESDEPDDDPWETEYDLTTTTTSTSPGAWDMLDEHAARPRTPVLVARGNLWS